MSGWALIHLTRAHPLFRSSVLIMSALTWVSIMFSYIFLFPAFLWFLISISNVTVTPANFFAVTYLIKGYSLWPRLLCSLWLGGFLTVLFLPNFMKVYEESISSVSRHYFEQKSQSLKSLWWEGSTVIMWILCIISIAKYSVNLWIFAFSFLFKTVSLDPFLPFFVAYWEPPLLLSSKLETDEDCP